MIWELVLDSDDDFDILYAGQKYANLVIRFTSKKSIGKNTPKVWDPKRICSVITTRVSVGVHVGKKRQAQDFTRALKELIQCVMAEPPAMPGSIDIPCGNSTVRLEAINEHFDDEYDVTP